MDLGTGHDNHGAVANIAIDAGCRSQFESFQSVDIAANAAMNDGRRHAYISPDQALLADRQHGPWHARDDVPIDLTFEE